MAQTQSEPSEVADEQGVVTVDGPGGVALTLTPEAAAETAQRLKDAARAARDSEAE
ncbi:MAG TPA: hypothetical protein VL405_03180 [Sphingomonas sp.]|jgi:hypothetical protein|nr:hypothetical protein [Sphingomonas sp.]